QRHGDLPVAQHLHRLVLADRALGDQVLRGHLSALRVELRQLAEVDDLVGLLEQAVGEALQLRHSPLERKLTALETGPDRGPGLGALGTTARGLALRGLTAALADPGTVRSRGRAEIVDLERRPLRHR